MYIYCEDKTCSNGTVTFTPVVNGVPLFSNVVFAAASAVANTGTIQNTVWCGINTTSAASVTFNCVTGTGILLGGSSVAAANNVTVRCMILGVENSSIVGSLVGKFDGVFYKVA